MNDVIIIKGSGGLGRRTESQDAISALVCNGVAVVGGVQLETAYLLSGVDDAHTLKINAAYDVTNKILVYEHISEFFRMNPNGSLFLYVVAQSETFPELVSDHAKELLRLAEGKIKRVGVAWNPVIDPEVGAPIFEPDPDTSAPSAQMQAIAAAQVLYASEFAAHRPTFFIIEGKNYTLGATPYNIRGMNAEGVMVVIGQSLATANLDATFSSYAAVGTALGARSVAAVNVKHSWVDRFNCYGGSLTAAGINGEKLEEIPEAWLDAADNAGAQFFRTHTGIPGYYFNHTATATATTSDYAFAENVETMNKASRLVRAALLPYLESPQKIDPKTGKLSPEVVKQFEMAGKRGLEEMLRNDEVSGIDVYVDPDQDLLSTSQLEVEFEIVPTGSASKIIAKLGFKNPF
jgi:hypothetical protein